MPIEPQGGYPDDWHVPPSAQGDSFPDDWHVPPSAEGDGFPDDWHVPPSAQGDGFPDDWSVPPSAAPGAAQAAPSPQSGAMASRAPTPPASDSFAAFLPFMPATRAAMGAWGQPLIGGGLGQSASQQVRPPALSGFPDSSVLGTLASPQPAIDTPRVAAGGLFGGIAAPKPESSDAPNYSSLFGGVVAPQSETGDAPSSTLVANRYGASLFGAPDRLGRQLLGSQLGSGLEPSLLQQTRFETSGGDEPTSALSSENVRGLNHTALPRATTNAGSSSEESPSSAPTNESQIDESDEPGSLTRVVRDSSGRPLAIIHVEPDQSGISPLNTLSDASPDGLRPGSRYAAQIEINNTAITNNPLIDRTTQFLLDALEQTAKAIGPGSGPIFGIRVHTDFGRRVKELDLPGIGEKGVEQSFHIDYPDVKYGFEGSIRTDVALRDPKNPDRGPIVVYDLKTGNAVLTPRRAAEIRRALGQMELPIIVLRYRTLDAAFPRGSPPQ